MENAENRALNIILPYLAYWAGETAKLIFQLGFEGLYKISIARIEKKGEDMYAYQASDIEDGASLTALLPPPPGYPIKTSSAAARLPCSRACVVIPSYYGLTIVQVSADKHILPSLSLFFDSDDDNKLVSTPHTSYSTSKASVALHIVAQKFLPRILYLNHSTQCPRRPHLPPHLTKYGYVEAEAITGPDLVDKDKAKRTNAWAKPIKNLFFNMYITENKSLEEIIAHFRDDKDFTPRYLAFCTLPAHPSIESVQY